MQIRYILNQLVFVTLYYREQLRHIFVWQKHYNRLMMKSESESESEKANKRQRNSDTKYTEQKSEHINMY